eukprot:TRINITY_DN1111_c0_g1_i1.p1 TRINITY_DN1111_c0_g1~~TRINITY_DN1111_c0_g1_i1.p1  ORF type:complete len:597 (-),score=102.44 TRINITY_DN1111_c0_g1_i1:89-1879(-)
MKALFSALICLLLASQVLAVSLRKPQSKDEQTMATALAKAQDTASKTAPPCGCAGNLFVGTCSDVFTARGKKKFEEVLGVKQAGNGHPLASWKTGVTFKLKMDVSSKDGLPRTFGFGSGNTTFLNFTVQPGVVNKTIVVEDEVERGDLSLHYISVAKQGRIDPMVEAVVEDVSFTNICVTTPMCGTYVCSKSTWAKKDQSENIPGNSDLECCEEKKCQDYTCTPATKWTKKADSDAFIGHSNDRCCVPIMCEDSVCSAADKKPISGSGLQGNTVDECCEEAKCSLYQCSHKTQYKPKANPHDTLMGKDDATCCDEQLCSAYTCSDTSLFKANASLAAGTKGSTDDECCEPQWCNTYTCSDATKYTKKKGKIQGQSDAHCCDPKLCSDFRCQTNDKVLITGSENRYGSTDADCCEKKFCTDYQCSDLTKWSKKADMELNGLRRRGFSDADCCTERFCQTHTCAPSSMWKANASITADVKGSTSEQCCEPIWCVDYNCSKSTQWTKKIDTNSFKHQGSTDLECCEPKWCSQFFTPYPSKWIRKRKADGSIDESLQGNSEAECYEPRYCSSFTCPPHKKLGAEPHKNYGSTEAECCIPV